MRTLNIHGRAFTVNFHQNNNAGFCRVRLNFVGRAFYLPSRNVYMSCLQEFQSLRQIFLTEMIHTRETDESVLCSIKNVYKIFVKKCRGERVLGRYGRFEVNVKIGTAVM